MMTKITTIVSLRNGLNYKIMEATYGKYKIKLETTTHQTSQKTSKISAFIMSDLHLLTNRNKLARIAPRFSLGYRQAVRHLVLVQAFRGSNPFTPATSLI